MAYANIPKVVHGGKLEPMVVKCRLLGWWLDETKGYRLEDVETRKLIMSRDIQFTEDDLPTNLVMMSSQTDIAPICLNPLPARANEDIVEVESNKPSHKNDRMMIEAEPPNNALPDGQELSNATQVELTVVRVSL